MKFYIFPTEHENADDEDKSKEDNGDRKLNVLTDDGLATVVDQVLDYDVNQDGYISFGEFRNAQVASSESQKKEKSCRNCGG